MKKYFSILYLLILFIGATLCPSALAANITATLDEAAGASVFAVNDSAAMRMSIFSSGNTRIRNLGDKALGGNKKGQDEIHPALALIGSLLPNEEKRSSAENSQTIALKNILKDLPNVSGDGACRSFYYKSVSKWPIQSQICLSLSRVPLFISFFDKPYTDKYESQAKYTKSNLEWQGKIFKKVSGKPDSKDIFAQIAKNFGNKFINFFFMSHIGFFLALGEY